MRTWTCQRHADGRKCGAVNPRRLQICPACGKRRPKTTSRRTVPKIDYANCVEMFGENCGICGREPPEGKKLHRDHDHKTGHMRGLLCFQCNRQLRGWQTVDWMERAIAYLRRAAESFGD